MSEETIIDKTVANEKPQQKKVDAKQVESKKEKPSMPTQQKKDGNTKKIVGASALSAAVGVAAGLLTPLQVFPQTSEVEDVEENEGQATYEYEYEHPEGGEMQVATSVDDSMTFSEAFAAARHEVGPGGLFTWHGHTYGTFYAEEWNAMSEEDKQQYWKDVTETTSHLNETNTVDEEISDVETDELIADEETPSEPEDELDGEEVDEEGEVMDNLDDLADAEIVSDEDFDIASDPIDGDNGDVILDDVTENELDDSLDIAIDDTMDDGVLENPDVDLLASNFENPDIPIDNDMDMSDFA